MPGSLQLDPSGQFEADFLGLVIYQVAQQSNPGSPMDSMTVQAALGSVWASVFSYMTTTFLIQHPQPRTVPGRQMRSENRLFITLRWRGQWSPLWVWWHCANVFLILHAERNCSILEEEPKGLFGAAVLLHQSDVTDYVATARGIPRGGLTVRQMAKTMKPLSESRFWYDLETRRIRRANRTPADEEPNFVSGSTETPLPAVEHASEVENAPGASPMPDALQNAVSRSSGPPSPVQEGTEIAQGLGTGLHNAGSGGGESQLRGSEHSAPGTTEPTSPLQEDAEVAQGLGTELQHSVSGGDDSTAEVRR